MRHPLKQNVNSQKGFTIIEIAIATFVIGTVIVGIFGLFVLSIRSSGDSKRRVVAVGLASERMEMVRNLPYQDVGTSGGIPSGAIPQSEVVVRNNLSYTVDTDIRYFDDDYDGEGAGDSYNADYKQVRVEVTWDSPNPISPVLLITKVVPQGVEGGDLGGTLDFQVLDADGVGVGAAEIHITNDVVDPPIDLTTQVNSEGRLLLPGLPESADSYAVSVTNPGFTTEQTYDVSPTFIPDSDHSHLSMIIQTLTSKTFFIDNVASLALHFKDDSNVAIPDVPYSLQGTKTIGVDDLGEPVYILQEDATADGSGDGVHNDLVWDSYSLTVDGVATGYDVKETSMLLPLAILPGDSLDVDVVLVPYTPITVHTTVVDSNGFPIDNATVQLQGTGFDESLGTGVGGQVFFSDLPSFGSYTLSVDAPGFQPVSQPLDVDEKEQVTIELAVAV